MNQSTCAGGTVHFTCVVMFTNGSPGPALWVTINGNIDASREPGHSLTDDSNGRSAPANVTTVLTVTNVSISDNGTDYFCAQGFIERSDTVFLTVFGKLRNYRLSSIRLLYIFVLHSSTLIATSFRNLFL